MLTFTGGKYENCHCHVFYVFNITFIIVLENKWMKIIIGYHVCWENGMLGNLLKSSLPFCEFYLKGKLNE